MPEGAVRDFAVPDLGEGLDDATVVRWLVAVGETVELNQPLCTVETAKAEVDVPSPWAGTVLERGGEEGDTLAVGSLLVRIETGEAADPGDPVREATLVGYGRDESLDRSRRPRARPPVRRLARRHGLGLHDLAPGSGPDGIVTRADVERAAADAAPPTTAAPAPTPAPTGGTTVPVRGVRARTAEHLTTAHERIPAASAGLTADASRLVELRAVLDADLTRRGRASVLTPFALLCRFVVGVLRADPTLNATWLDTPPAIHTHDHVHLGVATATDRGLLVPVIRDADGLSLVELAGELATAAETARAGTITPDRLIGSTFTVTNFGALGLDDGTPVINHPEAAILGIGAIRRRPWVVDDEVVARSTVNLTLTFDHRVADGAEAARFLTRLRELIETPELGLLDS